MTPDQERQLWKLAQERDSAVLFSLLNLRRQTGMSDDIWAFVAIKTLAEALALANKVAADAIGRAPVVSMIDAKHLGPDGYLGKTKP